VLGSGPHPLQYWRDGIGATGAILARANTTSMNARSPHKAIVAYCGALVFALASTGCASPNGSGTAASPQGFAALPSIERSAVLTTNVAGKYQGKFLVKGKVIGDADFTLTQSGTAAGGFLKLVLSKRTTIEPVAMTLDTKNNSFTGSATDPSGTACTYALSGSYNPKTFVLRGTSSPATCTGKLATFKTTETCYYDTGSSTNALRPNVRGIIKC
jgi:hypothetical protein